MINPPALALRRRAEELRTSALREMPHNEDSGALLLFYAAECALKSVYMSRNNLRHTGETRGAAAAARSFVHDLVALVSALNIPRSGIGAVPVVIISRTGERDRIDALHQAWRYGEKIQDTQALCQWLSSVIEWCKRNG
jgi:hypothetical protein